MNSKQRPAMRAMLSRTSKVIHSLVNDYCSYLGTLVTPRNGAFKHSQELWQSYGIPWACDNDAFNGFDAQNYRRILQKIPNTEGCLWVSLPDAVGDAKRTIELFQCWYEEVKNTGQPIAFVAQDGIENLDIPWEHIDALFVGGSTEFKLSQSVEDLVKEAKSKGKRTHMGRVNSFRRYKKAYYIGCDTVDGTNVCRWPDVYIPKVVSWCSRLDNQLNLLGNI